ncbi:hypothetical protein Psal006b_03541 (plasmid) [Piscirickettsia salmonis]|uniref:DNA-binding protein n=1 Tax=Piscirickettsia salmonis TaxID=1238 RepID=A0A1L6TID2_PISSA|nr:hypothetical protein [Piscirickettsia salmonis]ALB24367.1 DNA-binding protein [Piscirickettsia salmonis]ALT19002.1 hypothetical protein PSLF89_09215 [Piscirickettsia salmonis LF-89 = ATCC VR-1361]ALY04338.1 hypothetical protein AWE47_17390 [Piscirickettsia salmonis]AMA44085.1 hypothetical protein AWJ11_17050 [Piscirickettsia salmonis]AOS36868.1 hypothetical protein AVM72_15955 [Piscirickettsia salmonis]
MNTDKSNTHRITLRLPESLHKKLTQSSHKNSVSLTSEIVNRLDHSYKTLINDTSNPIQQAQRLVTMLDSVISTLSEATPIEIKSLSADEKMLLSTISTTKDQQQIIKKLIDIVNILNT